MKNRLKKVSIFEVEFKKAEDGTFEYPLPTKLEAQRWSQSLTQQMKDRGFDDIKFSRREECVIADSLTHDKWLAAHQIIRALPSTPIFKREFIDNKNGYHVHIPALGEDQVQVRITLSQKASALQLNSVEVEFSLNIAKRGVFIPSSAYPTWRQAVDAAAAKAPLHTHQQKRKGPSLENTSNKLTSTSIMKKRLGTNSVSNESQLSISPSYIHPMDAILNPEQHLEFLIQQAEPYNGPHFVNEDAANQIINEVYERNFRPA